MKYVYDAIPDLRGCICTSLIRQEYWFEGRLAEEAHVFYFQVDHRSWHRFLIDAGVLFWKVVSAPDEWHTTVLDQHHYPQIEMAEQFGLHGRRIESLSLFGERRVSELQIHFFGGRTLVIQNENDHNAFSFVDSACQGGA